MSMSPTVKDIWFRSSLPLDEIVRRLELRDVTQDAEDYWAWVIGKLFNTTIDITRTHRRPAGKVDTRIFVVDGEFTEPLVAEVVSRLRSFVQGRIWCGQWVYRAGNNFELVVTREFGPPGEGN